MKKPILLASFMAVLSLCAGFVMADVQPVENITVYGKFLKASELGLNKGNSAASRLGLKALDIPGSIEVISLEDIMLKGDFSGLSAVTRATGFSSSANPGNGGTSTSVRGFSGHGSIVNTYDGVRLYVGAGTVTFPADTWTVERVEVLRGPGSVINGVGAVGATVNYVPKSPTFDDISGEIFAAAGSFGLQRFALGSGGHISSELAYRIDAVKHETDGYVARADETRDAVSGSLLYQALDNLDIKLSVDYAEIDAAPYWGTPLVNGELPDDIRRNNYNVRDGLVEYEDWWPRLSVNWEINKHVTLRSQSFYMDAERHWRNVEGYEHIDGTDQVERSFYLEILHDQEQLGNRTDALFDFQLGGMQNRLNIGVEFNQIDFTHTNNRPFGSNSLPVNLRNPIPGTWEEGVVDPTTVDFTSDTFQYAVFLDNHLELNGNWSIVAGVRLDEIDFEREDFFRVSSGGRVEEAEEKDTDFSGTSWRLGFVYQPNENTSIYGQASKAVDSIQSIISATDTDLDLSEGEQVEIGIKQQLWDQRVQYTLAVFDIEKKNLLNTDIGNNQEQVGQQSSQGIEFELFVKATDSFGIDFNVALTDAEYDNFLLRGEQLAGNAPRNIPRKTANLWLNWQPVNDWLISGGVRYVGERYADDSNTVELPDYTVFDAVVQWAINDSLSLAVRGKNLTDEEDYVLSPYGSQQWVLADGRSGEVSLHYSF